VKRRLALIFGVMALVIGLTACSAIGSLIGTTRAVQDAGFQSVSVNVAGSDSLTVSVAVDATPTVDDAKQVAQVVWQNYHERFAYLYIYVHGSGTEVKEVYSFAQVQDAFGPRNPAWNATTFEDSTTHSFAVAAYVGLGVLAVGGLVAVLTVRMYRRRHPRAPFMAGPYPGPGYPPAGYGMYGPYPHPGYPPGSQPPGPYPPPAGYPPGSRPPEPYYPTSGPHPPEPYQPPAGYPPGSHAAEPYQPPPARPPYPPADDQTDR
jgi:hypothetical protein